MLDIGFREALVAIPVVDHHPHAMHHPLATRSSSTAPSAADVLAFEQAGGYNGFYFVLHGRLSPLDGIGPDELGLDELVRRIEELRPNELVLATNPTVEGEATAHYITQIIDDSIEKVSRIAHGVPLGSEIEYADGGTLTHALQGRRTIN